MNISVVGKNYPAKVLNVEFKRMVTKQPPLYCLPQLHIFFETRNGLIFTEPTKSKKERKEDGKSKQESTK